MAAAGRQSLYHSLAWYRNLVEHALEPGDEVRIYALEAPNPAQGALAILPLRLAARASGPWQGRGLTSLSNYYSSLWGPILADSGHDPGASLRRLVATVCADGRSDFIRLSPLSTEAALFPQLIDAFRDCGMIVQPYFCFGNWYLEVAGRTSDQYFGGLPSVLRNTISRKSKRLEAAKQTRIQIVTGEGDLDQAIADYERVYSASWKIPEPYPRFVSGLIRACAQMGWLRLGLLYVAGQPVAAQLWIVTGKTASIYKLAYDEKYATLSPGTVLTARLMRYVIDVDGVEVVDYLTGDDAYKKDWMSHRRERWGILAFNPKTVRGVFGIARHVGGRLLRNLLARSRPRLSGNHPSPADGAAHRSPAATIRRAGGWT
jgi:hypothetical protein